MKAMRFAMVAVLSMGAAMPAAAEKWLKIDPNDPYSTGGMFHLFDVDSAAEDRATGFVYARMIFTKPDEAAQGGVGSWMIWAFDCTANVMYTVASGKSGADVKADWRQTPYALDKPHMGGVTNMFAKKLCALKGSWPKGDLPTAPDATK
jgi:hypothetical protein